jgi:hypothetical protein
VASSLQPGGVGLFLGAGCLLPRPFAAGGNRSYPGFLGRNRWLMVPRVNYPDKQVFTIGEIASLSTLMVGTQQMQ